MSGILLAGPPEPTTAPGSTSRRRTRLLRAVSDIAEQLRRAAERDPRFERVAGLALELQAHVAALPAAALSEPAIDCHPEPARPRRSRRTTARFGRALATERAALENACDLAADLGIQMTDVQLADLRLGERTRRIFHDAGLTTLADVTRLPPERAADIPHLAPSTLAELRAGIFIALETAGRRPPAALPPPGDEHDLFDGLEASFNALPSRERDVLVLRTGLEGRLYSIDEVANTFGWTPEQVEYAEEHAVNAMLAQPAAVEASWQVEELCDRLGLAWDDQRLSTAIAAYYPNTRTSFARLAAWLMVERGLVAAAAAGRAYTPPHGVEHFDAMVVAALGRYGDLSSEALSDHVRGALPGEERDRYAGLSVAERVQVLGPAVTFDDGMFRLPDSPLPGFDDRHIRALNGLIGAMQKLGRARVTALTAEVNRRLPRGYHVDDKFVRAWLTRHPELFTQYDADHFRLASMDVDILCGLANSWLPVSVGDVAPPQTGAGRAASASKEGRSERIAADIEAFIRTNGPQPISRIRSHLYGRFMRASADAVIAKDPRQRFISLGDGLIGLSEDAPLSGV